MFAQSIIIYGISPLWGLQSRWEYVFLCSPAISRNFTQMRPCCSPCHIAGFFYNKTPCSFSSPPLHPKLPNSIVETSACCASAATVLANTSSLRAGVEAYMLSSIAQIEFINAEAIIGYLLRTTYYVLGARISAALQALGGALDHDEESWLLHRGIVLLKSLRWLSRVGWLASVSTRSLASFREFREGGRHDAESGSCDYFQG